LRGQIVNINPFDDEREALKYLLLNRTGCNSFISLRTFEGITYESFEQTAYEFKVAHKSDHDFFVSERESREDDYYYKIILEDDMLNFFIDNYQPEKDDLESFINEQLIISFELGHF
jgi:hypothetical protein